MECGIYSIKLNDEILYVGQSCNIPRRWRFHKWQLRTGIHANSYLQNIYNKYQELDFCVEEFVTDRRSLTKRECYYIKTLQPKCNFVLPDENDSWIFSKERNKKVSIGNLGKPKSLEHRRNIAIAKLGDKNPMFGKKAHNESLIEFDGKTMNITDWAKYIGITRESLRDRLKKWTIKQALTTPKKQSKL